MDSGIPSSSLRRVCLTHFSSSPPSAAQNAAKWKNFGSLQQRPRPETPSVTPLRLIGGDGLSDSSTSYQADLVAARSQEDVLTAQKHQQVILQHDRGSHVQPCPLAESRHQEAFQFMTDLVSAAQQKERCGSPKPGAKLTAFRKRKASDSSDAKRQKREKKQTSPRQTTLDESGDAKLVKKGKDALGKAKRTKQLSAKSNATKEATSHDLPLPHQSPHSTLATRVPYQMCTSQKDTLALIHSMEHELHDPDRIQVPALFAGVTVMYQGEQYSSFTCQAQDGISEWRRDPYTLLSLLHSFGFRWHEVVYLMPPDVGIHFVLHVLRELKGVEVITYDAPLLFLPLLIHAGRNFYSECVSDVRVMAWMSGQFASKVVSDFSELHQSAFEHHPISLRCEADQQQQFVNCIFYLAPLYRQLYGLMGSGGLLQPFLKQEKKVSLLTAAMKCNGALVDMVSVRGLREKCLRKMEVAKLRAAELLPSLPSFNIQSSEQCRHALYDVLHLDQHLANHTSSSRMTKTGKMSTAEECLRILAEFHELPSVIIEYRKAAKIIQNYIDGMMQTAVVPHSQSEPIDIFSDPTPHLQSALDDTTVATAVLYPNFLQEGTDTGRLSCVDPNLQNLPRASLSVDASVEAEEIEIRRCFVAPPQCLLVSVDYQQIELRILAHLCGDGSLIDALTHETDIHQRIAVKLFQKTTVTAEERNIAKRMVFGTLYGAGTRTLASQLQLPPSEIQQISSLLHSTFPAIQTFRRQVVADAKGSGFVRTMHGRLRRLPDIKSADATVRSYAERQAFNSVVQGSAADVMKVAMIAVQKEICCSLNSPLSGVQLLSQIHDELVFSVPASQLISAVPQLVGIMSSAVTLRVPLPVTVKFGSSLGALQPWTVENELGLV